MVGHSHEKSEGSELKMKEFEEVLLQHHRTKQDLYSRVTEQSHSLNERQSFTEPRGICADAEGWEKRTGWTRSCIYSDSSGSVTKDRNSGY